MDIYDNLQDRAIPMIKKFIEENDKRANDELYDVLDRFKSLVISLPEEVHQAIISAITDECCDVSDKIAEVFRILFPEFAIQKISFLDSSLRENFINYEVEAH